jgi:hypothetical protein
MIVMRVGLILFFASLTLPRVSYGGVLFNPGIKWSIFSFEPTGTEDTPNYQGVTGELKAGYSFRQVFDIAALGNYTAGNPGMVKLPEENANVTFYGGEIAARIYQTVYFGVRGGKASYQLLTRGMDDNEIRGKWEGPGFGFSLGAISPTERSKRTGMQFSFDFLQARVEEANPEGEAGEPRTIDQFSISITYVYNGYHNAAIENSFFSNYLDSLIFWE